jgi:hypothetical protein
VAVDLGCYWMLFCTVEKGLLGCWPALEECYEGIVELRQVFSYGEIEHFSSGYILIELTECWDTRYLHRMG